MYDGRRTWEPLPGGGGGIELTPDPALVELGAAVHRFGSAPRIARRPSELGYDLIQLRHLSDLLELQFAKRAADFATTGGAERDGSTTAGDWIRHSCKMPNVAVEKALCVGERFEKLPLATAAVERGEIGFQHLALLASTERALSESRSATGSFDEAALLQLASEHSVGRFRHDCAHARHAADAKAALDEHVELVDARTLELLPREDGAVVLRGFLDPIGGASLRTALEPLARWSGKDDARSRGKRLADALVELAGHALDSATLPTRSGQRPHLQVTATLETLQGRAGAPAAELEWAGPVPAATVQRLACDASVSRILFDSKSAVVDVGRARRVPSAAARRALQARDRGCVWPGCDRTASWTSAHHVRHWANDGATDVANMVLICYRYHWLIHEGGWELVRKSDGEIVKIPPLPRHGRSTFDLHPREGPDAGRPREAAGVNAGYG